MVKVHLLLHLTPHYFSSFSSLLNTTLGVEFEQPFALAVILIKTPFEKKRTGKTMSKWLTIHIFLDNHHEYQNFNILI